MLIWRLRTIFTGGSGPRGGGGGAGGATPAGPPLPVAATTAGRPPSEPSAPARGVVLVRTAWVAPPGGVGDQPLSLTGSGPGAASPPLGSGGRVVPVEPAVSAPPPFLTANSGRLLSFFARSRIAIRTATTGPLTWKVAWPD